MRKDVIDHGRQFAAVPFPVIEVVKDARALALYVILKRYAHHQTKEAHPSRKRLSADMGYRSTKAVDEAIEVLIGVGLVRTFPRFKDEDGVIGYARCDRFREQTSNGYIVYDEPLPPSGGGKETVPPNGGGPLPTGGTPPTPLGVDPLPLEGATPYPYRGHKLEPRELEPRELDTPQPPPAAGAAPQGAEPAVVEPSASKPSSRGTFLPEGWYPTRETAQKIAAEYPALDLRAEHEVFVDYWRAVSGAKGRKRDWDATWRNWMRRAGKPVGTARNTRHTAPSRADEKAAGYLAVAEQLAAQQGARGGEQYELGR